MVDMVEALLFDMTGDGCQYWMDLIGSLIVKHTKPSDNPLHGSTESNLWLRDLSDELWSRIPSRHDLTKLDENIICSSLLSLILTLWSCRIKRAKAYDPRRPVEIRKRMLKRANEFHAALLACMTDESHDHEYFPKQEWDPPFAPGAEDGDFV